MPNPLQEALARLIAESDAAEKVLAERVPPDAGGAALAPLFGVTEPASPASTAETDSLPPVEIDWSEVDAQIEAQRTTPDAAPATSEPTAEAALLAALNPEG